MSSFRLLAIIPLKDCNEKFYKNLVIGTPYKFNNDASIVLENDFSKIKNVLIEKSSKTNELYNLKNGIKVEISAIVGLNGSGKSALIELLYYTVYVLSAYNDKNKLLEEHSERVQEKINRLKKDADKLNSKSSNSINLLKVFHNNELSLNRKDFEGITNGQTLLKTILRKRSEFLHAQKNDDIKIEQLIKEKLSVAIVFQTEEGVFSVTYKDEEIIVGKYNDNGELESETNDFSFEKFFYSICLNYSHHSLNAKVIGNWINSLFHKNDGYATPVVINPMRENGNFNINRELHLSNERIMSNLTFDVANSNNALLIKKYELKKFLFFTKKDFALIKCKGFEDQFDKAKMPITRYFEIEDFDKLKSVTLVRSLLGENCLKKYTMYQDYALGYIEKKIDKIKDNYTSLFLDKKGNFNHSKFMAFLRTNKSHITKKLRSTISFIEKSENENSIWNRSNQYNYCEFNIDEFKVWLIENNENYSNLSPSSLMDFALPGFFNIDFEISTKTGSRIKLSELSSGEQQMIFNINTITYHLYNLQSVHSKNIQRNDDFVERLSYKNVSIILDEIEIYYHPDMQRELTYSILNSLENIKSNGEIGIESIHLIYLTHSPFILSDIPSSNILRLSNGVIKSIEQRTFASNIHDLLANDFFLKDGFMGEYARRKITETISYLNSERLKIKVSEIKSELNNDNHSESDINILKEELENIQNEFDTIKVINSDRSFHQKLIELIGEPVLRNKLSEMMASLMETEEKQQYLQEKFNIMAKNAGITIDEIKFKN